MKKKCMLVSHTYYPEQNGVQFVTQYMAEGLANKFDVYILTEMQGFPEYEEHNSVHIYRINLQGETKEKKRKYLDMINIISPDILVVVCTQSWTFDLIRDELNNISAKKILYTHGFSALKEDLLKSVLKCLLKGKIGAAIYYLKGRLYYLCNIKYFKCFNYVTYLHEQDYSYFFSNKRKLKNGIVLGNAVEDIFFEMGQERLEAKSYDEMNTFIYVANFEDRKNQKMLIKAYAEAKILNSRLVLIGSKENVYFHELEEEILKIRNLLDYTQDIILLVGLQRQEIYDWYRKATIMVCPSKWEAYSISLCEAAAAGIPIISTDVGITKYIKGVAIIKGIEDMIEMMRKLSHSPELRQINRLQLIQFAERNCKIESKVKQLEEVINKIS